MYINLSYNNQIGAMSDLILRRKKRYFLREIKMYIPHESI